MFVNSIAGTVFLSSKQQSFLFVFAVFFLLACRPTESQGQYDPQKYPFINEDFNIIQFKNRQDVYPFFDKWSETGNSVLSVLYMGDSHVQPDVLTGALRQKMQNELGDGGRGMMFPFSIARTYTSLDYKSAHTGVWTHSRSIEHRPKFDLGVSGATVKTKDPAASFSFRFVEPQPEHHTVLKIMCKQAANIFDFSIDDGVTFQYIKMDSVLRDSARTSPFITVRVNLKNQFLRLRVHKRLPQQTDFEFYFWSLESDQKRGCIVHNAGIGGAEFRAPLEQRLFAQHLSAVNPDMVVLDYGTNDYIYYDALRPDLERDIVQIIANIRKVLPRAVILLTSAQDMCYRGRYCRTGSYFSTFMKRIAREQNCGFFDWYWVSGGKGNLVFWQNNGLIQPDLVHNTVRGYRLKADLLFQAFVKTRAILRENVFSDSLFVAPEAVTRADSLSALRLKASPVPATPTGKTALRHTIREGQTLGGIAAYYKVRVTDIQRWNNLTGTLIRAGKTLIIYK